MGVGTSPHLLSCFFRSKTGSWLASQNEHTAHESNRRDRERKEPSQRRLRSSSLAARKNTRARHHPIITPSHSSHGFHGSFWYLRKIEIWCRGVSCVCVCVLSMFYYDILFWPIPKTHDERKTLRRTGIATQPLVEPQEFVCCWCCQTHQETTRRVSCFWVGKRGERPEESSKNTTQQHAACAYMP